jgi:hypothetical protein
MFEHYYAAWFSRALKADLASPAPAEPSAADPDESTRWDPCPCGRWGVCRADLHGCAALCKDLFPEVDRELDAWDAAHGWLYR